MDFMSDGALYGEYADARRRHHEANSLGGHDMGAAFKDVATLAVSSTVVAGSLSALASYRHKKDPKDGMPEIGPFGIDTLIGIAGLATAILAGPKLGDMGELIALGIGLGGINTAAVFYGGAVGAQMAAPKSVSGDGVGAAHKQMPQATKMSASAKDTLRHYGIGIAA